MRPNAIVLAMADPVPEVIPERDIVAMMAPGMSDFPHQKNSVLACPGTIRGAWLACAHDINEEMKLAAAETIDATIAGDDLSPDSVTLCVFGRTRFLERLSHGKDGNASA
jgi:malic enzyme